MDIEIVGLETAVIPYASDEEIDDDVRQINRNTLDTYIRLRRLYQSRAYERKGYDSWNAFCEDHFRYTPKYINMMLKAADDFYTLTRHIQLLGDGNKVAELHPLLKNLTEAAYRELRDLDNDAKVEILSQIAAEGNMPTPAEIKAKKQSRGGGNTEEPTQAELFDRATEQIRKAFLLIRENQLWAGSEVGYASYRDCCMAIVKANVLAYDENGAELPGNEETDEA